MDLGAHILHIPSELKKFPVNPVEPSFWNRTKTWILRYFGLFGVKKVPQNIVPGVYILRTSKRSSNEMK